MRYLLFAIAVTAVFTIFTTVFAASANKNQVRLLPKGVWVLLCLLVPIVGGLLYVTLGRPVPGSLSSGGRSPSNQGPKWGPGSTTRTSTIAPDDDPDFLRRLRERLNRVDKPNGDDFTDGDSSNGSNDGGSPHA